MRQARKYRGRALFLCLALGLCTGGCNHQKPGSGVMARVNGHDVLRSEVEKNLKRQISGAPQKPTAEQEDVLRLEIVRQMIDQQVTLQDAEKLGVAPANDEVENKVNKDKAPYTKEQFAKKLQETGYTEEEYRQEVRRNLTVEKLLKREVESKVKISDSDIQDFYNAYKAQFYISEPLYRLAHIFVSCQPNVPSAAIPGKAQNEAQAREKIQMAYKRLESGEDFAALAARYSEDPDTSANGGEMKPIPESQIKSADRASRDAVLKLKAGEFTPVIPPVNSATRKTLAYRIFKLNGKDAPGQRDVNDPAVQKFIRTQLRNQREQFLRTVYDEVLHDHAEIHNYFADQILKNSGAGQK